MKNLILVIALLATNTSSSDHPLKMTFSNLVISEDGKVELETRIFIDDLTAHMESLYQLQQVDFTSLSSSGSLALQDYFRGNLFFEQADKKVFLQINSISLSDNQMGLVIKSGITSPLDKSKEIFFTNSLLFDSSPMQTNDIKYQQDHYMLGASNPKMKIILD